MYPQDFKSLCNDILKEGRQRLAMSMGIVSHIHDDRYKIVAISSLTGVFVAGEDFPLKDTHCRDVYEQQKTIALTQIDDIPGLQLHPLYDSLALEAYISSPIIVDNNVWGTVNFSCMQVREKPFSDSDIAFVENAASSIANELISFSKPIIINC
ncbi:GAF domain-containing protein [Thalassotalea litorea]|uniref:GAF domain-containing protein n=1 Tax=Thalassotalea litorea TaxID=2020715 RepID=A0A5R9IBM5_9GAMM|nr:GAF domain-containing protein [Thalassotalea litorea]TLU61005.1 GAF domain-containing protein [Thalassotalea litorea]